MNRYLHLSFNHHLQNVLDVLKPYQDSKWSLFRIVPISDIQSILILESQDPIIVGVKEVKPEVFEWTDCGLPPESEALCKAMRCKRCFYRRENNNKMPC